MKKILLFSLVAISMFGACKKQDNLTSTPNKKGNPTEVQMMEEEDEYHHYARLGHNEDITSGEIAELDAFYSSLDASELVLFMNANKDILLEQCETQEETDEINNAAAETEDLINDLNTASLDAYNLPINQLTTAQRLDVLSDFANRGSGGCPEVNFPAQGCYGSGWVSCGFYQKVRTPDQPWDCDYEFGFPPNQNQTYSTTWWGSQLLKWWGGCLKKRNHSAFTGFLVGNNGVNFFYWGNASKVKKIFKTRP